MRFKRLKVLPSGHPWLMSTQSRNVVLSAKYRCRVLRSSAEEESGLLSDLPTRPSTPSPAKPGSRVPLRRSFLQGEYSRTRLLRWGLLANPLFLATRIGAALARSDERERQLNVTAALSLIHSGRTLQGCRDAELL